MHLDRELRCNSFGQSLRVPQRSSGSQLAISTSADMLMLFVMTLRACVGKARAQARCSGRDLSANGLPSLAPRPFQTREILNRVARTAETPQICIAVSCDDLNWLVLLRNGYPASGYKAQVRLRGGNGVCTANPRRYANKYATVVNRIKAFSDL